MPWFYFDLLVENHPQSQGAMILENAEGARDRADALADELRLAKSDLEGKRCYVRVINEASEEVYRTPTFTVPKWSMEANR
jgi:Domain of unknown function (DUF6894)